MKHFYENTEYGKACWACGLFVWKAQEDCICTQKHVEFKLKELDESIERLQKFKAHVLECLEKAKTE